MTALLRYPGAKWSLSKKLIDYFPKHKSYLELFFGSGAILFNKNKVSLETVNDIDHEVVNFFDVLRRDFITIQHELKYIPYSKEVYNTIYNFRPENKIDKAIKFFVVSWFSHGGYQPHKTGWSNSKNPAGPNKAVLFKNVVDSLDTFSNRLREVQIENHNALDLIQVHDYKDTFIYLDPPYQLDTRKAYLYKNELSNEQHEELINKLLNIKNAKVLLSGYDNDLYNKKLSSWSKEYISSVDGKGNKKTEVIWFNYKNYGQETLFN